MGFQVIRSRGQTFFVFMMVVFIIAIAIGVLFGTTLSLHINGQKNNQSSAQLQGLLLSGLSLATDALTKQTSATQATTTVTLPSGTIAYAIAGLTSTTSEIRLEARSGGFVERATATATLGDRGKVEEISIRF